MTLCGRHHAEAGAEEPEGGGRAGAPAGVAQRPAEVTARQSGPHPVNLVLLSWLQSDGHPLGRAPGPTQARPPSPAAPGAHSPAPPSPQPQTHAGQSPRRPRGARGSPGASQEPMARPALLRRRVSVTPSRWLFPSGHLDPAERAGDARPKLWCALQAGRVMVFDASSWSLHQHCVRVGSSTLVRLLAGRGGDGQAAG